MGGQMSKKRTPPSAGGDQQCANQLTTLQPLTSHAIDIPAVGVELRALSFDSLKGETECLLEMNQEVVEVNLKCKEDTWKNQELFKLVDQYFNNSLETLDFYTALEECLKRARDSQLLILVALQQLEEETEVGGSRYVRTLEELNIFKAAGDLFTEEFLRMLQSVYEQQPQMLKKLQLLKNELNKKLKRIKGWRKVSSMIFVTTFAAVLICSVAVAAMAATPPIVAALAASTSIPIGSIGKWADSLCKNYENTLKWQKEVISSMRAGKYVAIKDLDNIKKLIGRLKSDIAALLPNADFAIEEEHVKTGIEEIKKKLEVFKKNAEDLEAQADLCSRDTRQARTVILQRIIKEPNN